MARLELRPFSDEFLGDAGRLLAARHRRHREAEPLLPARYEDAAAAAAEVEALWRADGAAGAVALRGGRVTAFLVGIRKDDGTWGPNVWVDPAGHAAEDAEDVRDLYAAAAAPWVEDGRTRHYVVAPATDAALVEAWFRVGFGQQHAFAIRELREWSAPSSGVVVRAAGREDVEALVAIGPVLAQHQAGSPVFSGAGSWTEEEIRADVLEELEKPEVGNLVAELDGRVVGNLVVVPIEMSGAHVGLARPPGVAHLGFAAVAPEARGAGAGLALTMAGFAWALERGYRAMVTDWRATNLLASRFWPARGFRTTFLRLYRSIP